MSSPRARPSAPPRSDLKDFALAPRAPRCAPRCKGAFLWLYRDSLEADGVTVSVPKAKLDKIQSELASIKKLLGQ